MTIRNAVAEDAAAIERLFHEFVSYLRSVGDETPYRFGAAQYLSDGFGTAPAFRGLVAEDDTGAVVGYVLFAPTYEGDYVRGFDVVDLYVQEQSRGGGFGRALMDRVRALARAEGRQRISWSVHTNNTRAIAFYESIGAQTAPEIATMFLDVSGQEEAFSEAEAYERFKGRWSRRLAPFFVRFAGVQDGDAVLDVGSGTGALSAAVASTAPSSRVVGVDRSAPYVALAQSRHKSALVDFEVGDAQALRFEPGTFDRAISMLVFTFIPDARKALGELLRVTRRGGTIAAAVWDYGSGMEMLRVFWNEAVALDPAGAAKDERHLPLCRRGELAALWREMGLQDVVEEALTIETRFASFDDYWAPFLDRQGPAGVYTASLAPADRDALKARVRQRLLGDGPDRPIEMRARAWAVRGDV
jgi:SAM-dependent methyltransferase/L-amino acid N-acyltransferase YncA